VEALQENQVPGIDDRALDTGEEPIDGPIELLELQGGEDVGGSTVLADSKDAGDALWGTPARPHDGEERSP